MQISFHSLFNFQPQLATWKKNYEAVRFSPSSSERDLQNYTTVPSRYVFTLKSGTIETYIEIYDVVATPQNTYHRNEEIMDITIRT